MSAVIKTEFAAQKVSTDEFLQDVITGLSARVRSLPSKYFYDKTGSLLFDQICELDEYYPTRVEAAIMRRWANEMAQQIGSDVRLLEYGSGSSIKTRLLLDHLVDPALYSPIDISDEHLLTVSEGLAMDYPLLNVAPIAADFTKPLEFPETESGSARTCIYFPGSTIGNFARPEAIKLLSDARQRCESGDAMLIGFDLQKNVDVLEAAYNDRDGVTAAFNKNVLRRINNELGGDFDVDRFSHRAFYNHAAERIEMHLVSEREQVATIGDHTFHFGGAEAIRTEYSHKYTIDGFVDMAGQVGWNFIQVWTDRQDYFAVMYLER